MTNEEFQYWIEGYLTLTDEEQLTQKQIKIIQNHANLVKAVSGSLTPAIELFIEQLTDWKMRHPSIPISTFKELAAASAQQVKQLNGTIGRGIEHEK